MSLTQLGYDVQITPIQGMLELKLRDSSGKPITTQVAETYENLFAKVIAKLATDSLDYRQVRASQKGLSVL